MRYVLGSRASIGGVLGSGRGGAVAAWYLSGGVSAANCVAAYAPKGAASLAASYTNLANPGTYTAAPGVAPTFDTATGWTFAASAYLTTGITPANDRSWSMIVRYTNAAANVNNILAGSYVTPDNGFFLRPLSTTGVNYANGNGNTKVMPGLAAGVLCVAGLAGYRSGTAEATLTGAAPSPTVAIMIGALNFSGSPIQAFVGKIQAIAIYNTTLTAPQVAAISSAMSAL